MKVGLIDESFRDYGLRHNGQWHWSKADDARLFCHALRGKQAIEIVDLMGRTAGSVRRRLDRLGIKLRVIGHINAGRRPIYSKRVVDEVCRRLAAKESLRLICDDLGIDPVTLRAWRDTHPEFAHEIRSGLCGGKSSIAANGGK